MVEISEENENSVFNIQKILVYSSATAVDNSEDQSLKDVSISQFSDISIYIDICIILWYTIIKKGGKESGKEVKKNASNIGPIRSASD